jgi:hypothetical protein
LAAEAKLLELWLYCYGGTDNAIEQRMLSNANLLSFKHYPFFFPEGLPLFLTTFSVLLTGLKVKRFF